MKIKILSPGDLTVLQEDILYLARKINDYAYFNPHEQMPIKDIKRIIKNIRMHYHWRDHAIAYGLNIPANMIHLLSSDQRILWVLKDPHARIKYPYKQELGGHVIKAVLTAMAYHGCDTPSELTDLELRFYRKLMEVDVC